MVVAVLTLALWYTGHAVLSRFVGTCNQGDTGRFILGAMLGLPAAAVAAPLLLRAPAPTGRRMAAVLATALLAAIVLLIWVPLAISVGIQGHHLCGPEFDWALDTMSRWERLIPLAHAACASALLVGAVRGLWRARSNDR